LLDQIREEYKHPIKVTSGARCQAHNQKIGGAPKSAHVSGEAVDLVANDDLLTHILVNLDRYDVYIEDFEVTCPRGKDNKRHGWIHVQTRRIPSGKRIFKP
jgi:hypothetical protein